MQKYERIRNLREDRFLTQEKIAHALNLTQRTYSRYENGDSNIPLEILVEIAAFHNTSTDYLLNRTDYKKPYPASKKHSTTD
ncbi:MAG: helix-turn-helix domain-containing protein [Blautia sp.]|nr:helix-turn-helix domain-containing protein [Blautia sp.]MDY4514897.1 helix-turn-helix transcriptional regulator [Lachnospiraceae bacterium]